MEGVLYLLFLASVVLAGAPYARGAFAAGRIAAWCVVTIAMIAGPAALIVLLVLLDEAGLYGPAFVIGSMIAGGLVFWSGAIVSDDLASLGIRVVGWSMLIAPMLLSWVLFAFIPIALVLAFFVHPRWPEFRSHALSS